MIIAPTIARALSLVAIAGKRMQTSHAIAPANDASGNGSRPWNRRTPFQIIPQAMNMIAPATSAGTDKRGCGAFHNAIEDAPSKYAAPHQAAARVWRP